MYKIHFEGSGGSLGEWWNDKPDEASADVIPLAAGEAKTGVDVTLARSASISGKVSFPASVKDGRDEVGVFAYSSEGQRWAGSARLRPDGTFTILDIAPGKYRVMFEAGRALVGDQWWKGAASFDTAQDIVIGPNEQRSGIDAQMVAVGGISGTVTLPPGVSRDDVSVEARAFSTTVHSFVGAARVMSDGTYEIRDLPQGTYQVSFQPTGGAILSEWWNDVPDQSLATSISVKIGTMTKGVNASLAKSASVSGKVTLPPGVTAGSGSITVTLYSASGYRYVTSASVETGGRYTLSGVRPGSYKVEFRASGLPVLPQWWKGKSDYESATTLTLGEAQARSGIDVTLAPSSSISGKVNLPSGVELASGALYVTAYSGTSESSVASTAVRTDGSYEITGIAPGSYKLSFTAWKLAVLDEWWNDKKDFASANTITLASGQKRTGVNVTLAASAGIRGTVKAAGGAPILQQGVWVEAYDLTGRLVGSGEVRADGTYEIVGLTSGSYKLAFRVRGREAVVVEQWWAGKSDFASASTLTLVDRQMRMGVNVTLARAADVRGTVVIPAGIDTSKAGIVAEIIRASDGERVSLGLVAADGSYRASQLPAGTYKVRFSSRSGALAFRWWGGSTEMASAKTLTVRAGEVRENVSIALTAGGMITGKLTLPAGIDLNQGRVLVSAYTPGHALAAETTMGSDGTYTLSGLPTGSYKVLFSASYLPVAYEWWNDKADFASATKIAVQGGKATRSINAVLAGSGAISGKMTLPPGVTPSSMYQEISVFGATDAALSVGSTRINADGTYTISGLRPGTYKVRFTSCSLPLAAEWWNNKRDFTSASPVSVTGQKTTKGIDITLARASAQSVCDLGWG